MSDISKRIREAYPTLHLGKKCADELDSQEAEIAALKEQLSEARAENAEQAKVIAELRGVTRLKDGPPTEEELTYIREWYCISPR